MKRVSFDYGKLLRRFFIYTFLKNVEKKAVNSCFFWFYKEKSSPWKGTGNQDPTFCQRRRSD